MRRNDTGAALTVPLPLSNRHRGGGEVSRAAIKGASRQSVNALSRIVVLPVSISRAGNEASVEHLMAGGMIHSQPVVPAGAVDRRLLSEAGADVVLLDGQGVRPSLVYRAVVRIRGAGWTGGLLLSLDEEDVAIVAVASSVGATDFVMASATAGEVEARLRRAAVRGNPGPADRPVGEVTGDIQLHWRTHQVSFEGTTISLTHRQMQLLATFIERTGEVIASNDLARFAWGDARRSGGALATTFVCSLRKKLAWFGGRFGIQTVRGVGYRFVI